MGYGFKFASLFLGVLSAGCSSLVYHPSQQMFIDPKRLNLEYENVHFESSDGKTLVGWVFPAQLEKGEKLKGTVIQFHGNAENRTTHFLSLVWLIKRGFNVFTFDYRGYHLSEGTPDQEGVYRDGMAAIRFAKKKFPALDHPDLILYGQSLGGAVLSRCYEDVVDRSRILTVVIEGSFDSYQRIAQNILSRLYLLWPFQWLGRAWISDQYSPERSFAQISPTPLLVIHGTEDRTIPYSFGQRIFSHSNEPKNMITISGGKHLDTYFIENGKYRDEFVQYLDQLIKKETHELARD